MKIRIKFRKYGEMKYIGHLDIMRYFQKALKRANIPVSYSGGFSPHMIMSFASPLGVGLTSDGEYMDIEVEQALSSADGVRRLNAVMAEGIEVVSFRSIPDGKAQNAMALVAAADYQVRFRPGTAPAADLRESFAAFLAQPEIRILKKSKKTQREMDIRPFIYGAWAEKDCIFLHLCAGSVTNIKPEAVIEAFCAYLGQPFAESALLLHRVELYGRKPGETDPAAALISLEEMGSEFGV